MLASYGLGVGVKPWPLFTLIFVCRVCGRKTFSFGGIVRIFQTPSPQTTTPAPGFGVQGFESLPKTSLFPNSGFHV